MRFFRCRIAIIAVLSILLAPFAIAKEIRVAKVYRDYPGYIESPTCKKPPKTPHVAKQPAKETDTELASVEESIPKVRARKVYRDYPGYIETPTCINPRMAPSYIATKETRKDDAEPVLPEPENLEAEETATQTVEEVITGRITSTENTMETNTEDASSDEASVPEMKTVEVAPVIEQSDDVPALATVTEVAPVKKEAEIQKQNHVEVLPGVAVIETEGLLEDLRYFTLTDPSRLVVDVYSTDLKFENGTLPAEDGFDQVRMGVYEDKVRFVFDAEESIVPEHTVEQVDSDIVVSWTDPDIAADKAEAERIAEEKLAAEQAEAAQQAEQERLAAEKLAVEKAEAERLADEKLAAEKAEAERIAAEKLAAEKAEAERVAAAQQAEQERLAAEKLAAEQAEVERLAAEKLAAEKSAAERIAAAKLAAEKAEAERVAAAQQAEQERLAAEKLAAEQAEVERLAAEKLAAEEAAAERIAAARLAAEKAEAERIAAAEKAEAEKIAAAKLAAEKAEAERVAAAQQVEQERLAAEKLAAEQAEVERLAAEKLAAEKAEAERIAAAKLAAEQAEAERIAAENLAAEKAEADRVAAAERAEQERLAAEKAEAERVAAAIAAAEQAEAEQREVYLDSHFPSFVATLQESDVKKLNQLAEQLKTQKLTKVEIVGHSDSLPIVERSRHIFANNQVLSEARARNVARYLQQNLGVPSHLITLRGLGASMPAADNSTEAGRALNRRVEISLVTTPTGTETGQEVAGKGVMQKEQIDQNTAESDLVVTRIVLRG